MAQQYKRSFSMYPAWSYQKEIEVLNRQSELGWQLIRGGNYLHTYKRNSDVQYRYQLDYTGKVEDMGRYIETFREQGWEYVNSTFNGWNFFRKPYDPSLSQECYEIFTDLSSLKEMIGRWIKIVSALIALLAVCSIINIIYFVLQPNLPFLVRSLAMLLEILFFTVGILRMRNPEKSKTFQWDRTMFICVLVTVLAGLGCSIYLEEQRPHLNAMIAADYMAAIPTEIENANMWACLDIKYADNYYVDLSVTADSPICVSILNESGDVFYTVTDSSADILNQKLHLQRGTYSIYFSDYEGGRLEASFSID